MASVEYIAGRKKNGNELFNNKIFIFFLSFLFAVVIWCVISMYETPETERVFQDVKVQMSLADTVPGSLEMSVFGTNEFYCDVTVVGKGYLVTDSTFTSDKIKVKPELDAVREPGVYEVRLSAQLTNASGDLSVVSVEPAYVTVYFDKTLQRSFQIIPEIDTDYLLAQDCTVDSMEMSKDYIIVSGPSLEMNRLKDVKAHVGFVDTLQKSVHQPCTFEFVTADGIPLTYSTVLTSQEDIYLDVQISKEKSFEMIVDIVNVPVGLKAESILSYYIDDFAFRNSTVTLNIPTADESLMAADRISIGQIDFAALAFTENQTVQVDCYDRDIFMNVLPETIPVNVYLDTAAYSEVVLDVPVEATEHGDNVTIPETLTGVSFIVPADSVQDFSADGFYAVLDEAMLEDAVIGDNQIAVSIKSDQKDSAWVRGSYQVTVSVADENATEAEDSAESSGDADEEDTQADAEE